MANDRKLAAVLSYAAKGYHVFPLYWVVEGGKCSCGRECGATGKHPLTRSGVKDATTSDHQIKDWWTHYPHANIGIATGAKSGIIVVDIDDRHNGSATLIELIKAHRELPATLSVKTGSGFHLYFKSPGTAIVNSAGLVGPGIDVRGDGGYVVAPPSIHASGVQYRFQNNNPVLPLPEWLGQLALAKSRKQNGNTAASKIPEGQRNNFLTSRAGTMRRTGFSKAAILAALLADNKERCQLPLSHNEVEDRRKCVAVPCGAEC